MSFTAPPDIDTPDSTESHPTVVVSFDDHLAQLWKERVKPVESPRSRKWRKRREIRHARASALDFHYTYTPTSSSVAFPTRLFAWVNSGSTEPNLAHIRAAFLVSEEMLLSYLHQVIIKSRGVRRDTVESDAAQYSDWMDHLYSWRGNVGNHAIQMVDMVIDAFGHQRDRDAYAETKRIAPAVWRQICTIPVFIENTTFRLSIKTLPAIDEKVIQSFFSQTWNELSAALSRDVQQQRSLGIVSTVSV